MSSSTPIVPLTRHQRTILLCVAAACAATRFLAVARSLWDWDEALFMLAMRDYDVTLHHPHPPGFPVFIALAKLARLIIGSDFRALQAINVIAAMLVFPAMYLFARELRLRFETSVIAAALFAFFPNVWFFGGTAFSDIPSIVLVLFAVTFLLRGAEERNAYWLGTLLLALAIGIRPQNLLLGLLPGIYATRKRRAPEIVIAVVIGLVVVGVAFGSSIYATGSLDQYLRVVQEHSDYISRVDSWRSPARPPLWRLLDRFFVKQYQSPPLSVLASLFALGGIVAAIRNRNRAMLFNALTFVPFAIAAWLMLDRYSVSRFSIGYQPMFALFIAYGIERCGLRRAYAIAGVLIAAFIVYTVPALNTVRDEIAPPVLAAHAVAQHVDPRTSQLFVGHTMTQFVDLMLPGMAYTRVIDDRALPLAARDKAWLLAEITETPQNGYVFRRKRGHLWNIARRHYFEIKLEPVERRPHFVSGWYAPESMDIHEWRWMSGHSVTLLPPARGATMLRVHFGIPGELMPQNPEVTIRLNGRVIEAFHTSAGYIERDYHVAPAPRDLPNVLELSIDHTINPARLHTGDDSRELGLRLRYLAWGPA